jgi:hypothetical protein
MVGGIDTDRLYPLQAEIAAAVPTCAGLEVVHSPVRTVMARS